MRRSAWAVLTVLAASFSAGCATKQGEMHESSPAGGAEMSAVGHAESCEACAECPLMGIKEAIAAVHATQGNNVSGFVRFVETAEGVRVTAEITGLKPNAKHAFHIHEFGDCTSADGKSAGGHYNPGGHPHAGPDAPMHHAGDLGNLETDANGAAKYDRMIAGLTIAGMQDPVLGRSVVIHAGVDDLTSQPAGNAGDRIACGVIGVAKPAAK